MLFEDKWKRNLANFVENKLNENSHRSCYFLRDINREYIPSCSFLERKALVVRGKRSDVERVLQNE